MTSNKPYLIRALYEWLVDNDATPYMMVDATQPNVDIPPDLEKDGQVVLNIAARAVQGLEMSNEYVSFSARFAGVPRQLFIPVEAIMAIYSMEDGQGMMFADDTAAASETLDKDASEKKDANKKSSKKKAANKKPGLTIVK